ncbi:Hsp70 family protein [Desulfuromonas sp. TF]|uniref:Hsp70 family protein n=1 Tax=Desulfuromonas sp. TF TaxID=1232410 RepID=UPI00040F87A1|nr:Hsp70 family protein [Desulfuromonas sp. TF]
MPKTHAVGIDLGTTNSAMALAETGGGGAVHAVPITQAVSFQAVEDRELLPSAVYFPLENEIAAASLRLPWGEPDLHRGLVGRFAREHGGMIPDRLVTSAKSWLGNPHVDPRRPVLPWNPESGEGRVSAFEANRLYLEHLRGMLEHELARRQAGGIEECEIVLTVPASFDEVARNLTHEAAAEAGLGEVTLLEEQQAAFYHWLSETEDWREQVRPGDIVLICDVGGGTSDFSLVAVSEREGNLELERISVGDHILLGGDNMDLALAHILRGELSGRGHQIDHRQFLALVHSCRTAKERLFADPVLGEASISLPSRGSGLFAGTITTALKRETLEEAILNGFFPRSEIGEHPARRRQVGFREFGLPYAADPALSRHLAFFLSRSCENALSSEKLAEKVAGRVGEIGETRFIRPSAVLFNGGVFKAEPLRRRVLDLLQIWCGEPVRALSGIHLDLAVAKGAAAYARIRITGEGIRIRAGTARSYYLGLESSMPAVPGFVPPLKAVCVAPQGMEEGTEEILPGREFGLLTGEPAEFRFFSSSVRAGDAMGTVVENAEELEETASLEATLSPLREGREEVVPVTLHSVFTELGTLELWLRHEASGRRWKLAYNLRGSEI